MSRVDTLSTWDNLFPRGGPAPYVGNHCCKLNGSSMFIVRLFGDKVTEVFSTSELAQRSVQWVHVSGSSCSRQSLIHSASLLLCPPPLSLSSSLSPPLSLPLSFFRLCCSTLSTSVEQEHRTESQTETRTHSHSVTDSLFTHTHSHTHSCTHTSEASCGIPYGAAAFPSAYQVRPRRGMGSAASGCQSAQSGVVESH